MRPKTRRPLPGPETGPGGPSGAPGNLSPLQGPEGHQGSFPGLSVPEITWTAIGEPWTRTATLRAGICDAIAGLTWIPLTERRTEPLGIASAIKGSIERLRIPAVAYAHSHGLAPFELLGIEGRYRNGTARIYLLDIGTEVVVLRCDFTPTKEAPG